MNIKATAALVIISSAAFSGCATDSGATRSFGPAMSTETVYSDSYMESRNIRPISYTNLVFAHLSGRFQEYGTIDQKFTDETSDFLGFALPDFNRLYYARKVSGKGPDAVSDLSVLEKYRPKVIAVSPNSEVYFDSKLSVSIVSRGQLNKTYDDKSNGLIATFGLKSYSETVPTHFATNDHATAIVLDKENYVINIPYPKADFQQEVHDAIKDNRALEKTYSVRLIMKIKNCRRGKKAEGYNTGLMVCTPQLLTYQLFDGTVITPARLIKTAAIRLTN
jgi:hypothetical protein